MAKRNIWIDLETTHYGPDNSPEAHYKENEVVLAGWHAAGAYTESDNVSELIDYIHTTICKYPTRIIAHNLKFDLKYLLREDLDVHLLNKYNVQFACTMQDEYILTGQKEKFISLENLCEKYNVDYSKSFDLSGYINSGGDIKDVPKETLSRYLKGDVEALRALYSEMPSGTLNWWQMGEFIKNLACMELNGLKVDRPLIQSKYSAAVCKADTIEDNIKRITKGVLHVPEEAKDKMKWLAPRTVSSVLFGHPSSFKVGKHEVYYKGKIDVKPLIEKVYGSSYVPNSNTGYSTGEAYLKKLVANKFATAYINQLLEYRHWTKLIDTYYGPFLSRTTDDHPYIYPTIHYTSTGTRRTSSANPNGQNMPTDARRCVRTRWENGAIIEVDFSQLEVAALAHISEDPQLIADLKAGVDIHYEIGRDVMRWKTPADMTKETRRTVKNVVFGMLYGGGAATLAEQGGTTKKVAQQIIDSFYRRYRHIEVWQGNFYKDVLSNAYLSGHDKCGEPLHESLVKKIYGEQPISWWFKTKRSPDWLYKKTGDRYSFTPTQTKNYPIQGFAGGVIVPLYINKICREDRLTQRSIILTVHDSVLLDMKGFRNLDCDKWMQKQADELAEELKLKVPLKVECVNHGTHWK